MPSVTVRQSELTVRQSGSDRSAGGLGEDVGFAVGEADPESGAAGWRLLDMDRPLVGLDQTADDEQTQARSAGAAMFPELGEHARPDLLVDTGTFVVDDDLSATPGRRPDRDLDVALTVLDGVLDQVGHHLSQLVAVDPDLRPARRR